MSFLDRILNKNDPNSPKPGAITGGGVIPSSPPITIPTVPVAPAPISGATTAFVINAAGLSLVRYYEGLYLTASADAVGIATIGYGRILYDDGSHVKAGDKCTEDKANQWLKEDLEKDGAHYVRAWTSGLNDNQFSALTSFCFNRGAGRFRELLAMGKDPSAIALNLLRFDYAGNSNNHLLGLMRRRRSEQALFNGDPWEAFKTWTPG